MTIPKISNNSHAHTQEMDTTRQEVCLFLAKENFLRSLIGNKLTLSVFVSMFHKDRKKRR